jgi:NADH dehydrogenase
MPRPRPRIVIVGAGFAGHRAARVLSRLMRGTAEIVLVNPTDYFLYTPLMPDVAAGVLEPRRITVPLAATLPKVRVLLGTVDRVDVNARRVHFTDPEDGRGEVEYDQLILSVGSVNKLLPIPGVAEHARGFRSLPEALYLRDHLTRQVELASAASRPAERDARCTFVVVGAGYTGTEVAAAGQLLTRALLRRHPELAGQPLRWLLLDIAQRVLPELDPKLSRTADKVLRGRGVDVRLETSVEEATPEGVRLTDGEFVPARTLVWCVGLRPDPLVEDLDLPTRDGRLVVGADLTVPGHPEIIACGDAAAVPDVTRPDALVPMTAQHAHRQGKVAAHNTAAAHGRSARREYTRHDLGFAVDLGGVKAAADPFGVKLSGPVAKAVTRGYHLLSVPANRARIAADWLLDAAGRRQTVQLGLVRSPAVPLDTASPELPKQ